MQPGLGVSPEAGDGDWLVLGWEDCLERWITVEHPPQELRSIVVNWLMTRLDDPHQGVRRMPEFVGWWFGKVAGSDAGFSAVYCTYQINGAERVVQVRSISTLNRPV